MKIDKYVEGYILSTCNALGSEINGVYEKGKDCIECLKDILRYLKRDDDDNNILRFLGSIRLLQTDLLSIIKRHDNDKEVFDFTLRIMIALTNPALLLYKEDVPDDKLAKNVYLQIVSYLQEYKKAFNDADVWKILYENLKNLLKIRPIERSSEEKLFIERIIILIRNVLHVPSDESVLKQTDNDLSIHDKILQCLHESKLNILILYMSANEEEHSYCLHVIEIVSLMFREHTAETLANSNETRSAAEKEKDLSELRTARLREQNMKLQKIQSSCASRFRGVYQVKNMKSISDNDYICHKLVKNVDEIKFDINKNARRKPKNRVRPADVDNSRQSTLSIRLLLKKFCIEFLKSYNKLLMSVKRELLRQVSDEHDDTYYLWAISYFMQFNRFYSFEPALVSETISIQSFHHIQTQITNYQEMMFTDKKKTNFWARRMQLGVSTYKELLETLKVMCRSPDEVVKEGADALISHVFYVIEYREMLLSLLSNYNDAKFPLSYLAELVESAQLFLKMLENHSKQHSEIIVQKKQKKIRRKKKKKPAVPAEPVNVEDQLKMQWEAVSSELSATVEGLRTVPSVTPFDGASDISFEEQKVEAVYKIREALVGNEPQQAVGLLRAARELWPEGDSFGVANIEPEAELLVLKEIHFSNLQRSPKENAFVESEGSDSNDEEDEEAEAAPSVTEQKLDISDVYKKYASPKVVQPCSLLLANYRNNKPQTNMCLIKLLHRIAWNCKMHALFFQSTIFLTFQKIFHDPDINIDPVIKEFYRFSKFIMQKFFAAAEKNEKIYVELLFWKGTREAYELEEGYGASENKKREWTEEDEEELKYLYEENKDIYIEGQDVADIILANFNHKIKTKRQVIAALKGLGLIKSAKDLKPHQRKEWLESEIVELQHLFEDNKNSDDIMSIIVDKLSIKRSRRAVVDKLLELNLISDRKEVRKKFSKRGKRNNNSDSEDNSASESETSDTEYNQDNHIDNDQNSDLASSGEENEINFFKNLEAERNLNKNSVPGEERSLDSENIDSLGSSSKNEKNKRSKVWDEQEIMELTALFHENQDSDNIMQILLDSLSIKRPEKAIMEKLLELRLISDKKEIKKKGRKSEQKKRNMHHSPNGKTLQATDGEDSENDLVNSASSYSQKLQEKKKMKRRVLSDSSDEDNALVEKVESGTEKNNEQKTKNTKQSKPWREEEINELNQLFLVYNESDDVISSILVDLTTKRTRKDILEKMLEIGLIKDKKEVQKKNASKATLKSDTSNASAKPKKKKVSDVWDEQEVIELNQLYEKHKDSNDIMTDILNGLSVKRNKQNVVEKMLELKLIQDKKEIRKKRTKKMKAKHDSFENYDSNEDEVIGKTHNGTKKYPAESSDDESLPLNNIVSSVSKNSRQHNSSNIFTVESDSENIIKGKTLNVSQTDTNIKLDEAFSEGIDRNEDSGVIVSSNESSFRNNKRKRLLIISDDSSDEDDALNIKPVDEFTSETIPIVSNITDSLEDNVVSKKKKKMRVLEDSDDSS